MFLQLQQESLLLGRRPVGFTEHYFTEWDDGLGKEKIALFLLLSIGSTQVPGSEVGKEAFQLLQDHFLDDLAGDPYDRFENALKEINAMVSQKEKELDLKFIPNLNVIIGVIQRDMLFLSQRGEAQGYLIRKRHVSSITDGLYDGKNKEDLFQNIASGILEVGDTVLFVTGPLVHYVTPTDLSKIFSEQALGEATKELDELLQSDIEEQMALLSMEVLERTEEMAPVGLPGERTEGEASLNEEEKEEKENRLTRAVAILREFAARKDRFQFLEVLDSIRHWNKKRLLMGMGILVVVIVGGLFVLSISLGKQRALDKMEEKLALSEDNIAQAETRGAFDKTEADVLLDQAETLAIEVLNSGYLGGQASQILDLIEEQRDYLDNVQHITDQLKLLVDLSSVLGGDTPLGVETYSDRIVVYTEQEAYQILLDQVEEPDILDAVERVVAGHFFDEYDRLVLLTAAGKVIEYTDGNSQFADTADVTWHTGVDIATYSNKVYILDPSSNQIWKYGRGTGGYGSAQAYFTGELDLSQAVSLAIDGNIWALQSDGVLRKFLSGSEVEFSIKKAPLDSLEGASKVYTELEIAQVYILDPANERLFVFDKSTRSADLTYNAQYVFDDLEGILMDFYVDKDRNVIVLLTDRGLYELSFE